MNIELELKIVENRILIQDLNDLQQRAAREMLDAYMEKRGDFIAAFEHLTEDEMDEDLSEIII